MRPAAVLLTIVCLAACSASPTWSEQGFLDQDEWRQKQAALDADAILRGMEQARQRAEALAGSAR